MNKQLTVTISLVVIVVSVFFIFRQMRGSQPKTNLSVFNVLGEVAAEQAIKAANNRGQVALWVLKSSDEGNPVMKAVVKNFTDTLKKSSAVRFGGIEKLMTTGESEAALAGGSAIPRQQFLDLLRKYTGTDIIVSFIGVPKLSAQELRDLGEKHPMLVVVDTFEYTGQANQYDPAIVKAAIVPRLEAAPAGQKPKTPRALFDRYFQVLTAE